MKLYICFLRLNSGSENVTNPVLVVVNLPPILLHVILLLSSVLMNEAEVYASRMMLLMEQVSASALSRCFSLLIMRLAAHYQLSGCPNNNEEQPPIQ
jgi:small neutral amino acid transporter SnatA (MarC family)